MDKYIISGKTYVNINVEVEAEDIEEAMEKAEQSISGLVSFCGNGGTDKLVGVSESNMSVEPSEEIEWFDAEIERS